MKGPLDKLIKDAMDNLHVEYDPQSWDAMQERMEGEFPEDAFENEVRSQMNDLQEPYRHSHWLQLKDWLDYSWYAANKVYVSKVAEAGLMILALFTFFNSGWYKFDQIQSPEPVVRVDQIDSGLPGNSETLFTESSREKTGSNQDTYEGNGRVGSTLVNSTDDKTTNSSETDVLIESAGEGGDHDVYYNSTSERALADGVASAQSARGVVETLRRNGNSPVVSLNRLNVSPLEGARSGSSTVASGLSSRIIEREDVTDLAVSRCPMLNPEFVVLNDASDVDESVSVLKTSVKVPRKKLWSISAFGDIDFNHITTPFDKQFQKTGYDQNKIGTGGGIMLHRDMGTVELSTGAIYASKQYSPERFIELFRRTPEDNGTEYRFEGIRLNVLTVPIHVAYHFNKKGKWRPYLVAGGAIHLALQAEYDKEAEALEYAAPAPIGALETIGRQPEFEQKKFPDGLLEDGPFYENHYFTVDLGVGIERSITPSTSLFVQPTVFYNLFDKGISANNDKINTFSLLLGAKVDL